MRHFWILLTILFITYTLPLEQLYAKRFGGGRSFGVQRSINANPMRRNVTPMNSIRQTTGRWLPPMLGLLAGGIIGSLLMSHGFGTGILSWLLLGGAILLILNFIRGRKAMTDSLQYQSTQSNTNTSPFQNVLSRLDPRTQNASNTSNIMQDDDVDNDAFLRNAKVIFLRLQAAYDTKDIHDIKQYTAPQVFAEIQMQLQERGDAFNKTEVTSLEAELLEMTRETEDNNDIRVASVRFSGYVKEDPQTPATSFTEVWHFHSKPYSSDWLVAGIQQV